MQLSEREKRYVILLFVMFILAFIYFFYTLIIEPYQLEATTLKTEIVTLEQQEQQMIVKLAEMDSLKVQVDEKMDNLMVDVAPFYPGLPQDRLLLLVLDLVAGSGLKVSSISYSDISLVDLKAKEQAVPVIPYRMKEISDTIQGGIISNNALTAATETATEVDTSGFIPRMQISLAYEGMHSNIQTLIKACESLERTVAIQTLEETIDPAGLVSGNVVLTFFAIEKPMPDPFMDWSLEGMTGRSELFQNMYAGTDSLPANSIMP